MSTDEQIISEKFKKISPYLDERTLRIWVAVEALALPRGGISMLEKITKLSRPTIYAGIDDLKKRKTRKFIAEINRTRKLGGGRKQLIETNHELKNDLEKLIDPATRGDPMSPLKWTSKSTYHLAAELNKMGHKVSQRTVYNLLVDMEYSLQSNRKTKEGCHHPDRDEQFQYISKKASEFQGKNQPVISVDSKKKELIGEFKNAGKEWSKKGEPTQTKVYDFQDKELGKVTPYGIYDITKNNGWVSVGMSANTAEFAVESIRNWWEEMGKKVYPNAKELLITADGGGSNGARVKLWKMELQKLSNEIGIEISVSHFPPGTSKWNKIEHRMFCHITENWRGRPLISREVVVNLIGNTKTKTGLKIKAKIDETNYKKGIKITDKELEGLKITRDLFHGDWNYKISPQMH